MKTIKVGIVGCGKIAEVSHLPRFLEIADVQVTALCDRNSDNLHKLHEKLVPSAGTFEDFEDFINSADIDAVSVCTPNNLHLPMVLKALDRGLHVMCEKPLAGTYEDCCTMTKAAGKAGKVLHVNQTTRYDCTYTTVANLVQEGKIGDPLHIWATRTSGSTPDKGWSKGAGWFVSKESQGGIILDIAVHMVEIFSRIMGPVREVCSMTDTRTPGIDVVDSVNALLRFTNGSTGVFQLSWCLPAGSGLMEIHGSKGRIRIGFDGDKPIELTSMREGNPELSYPELCQPGLNSFESFIKAIRDGASTPSSGDMGRDLVGICEAISKAGETGNTVELNY